MSATVELDKGGGSFSQGKILPGPFPTLQLGDSKKNTQ